MNIELSKEGIRNLAEYVKLSRMLGDLHESIKDTICSEKVVELREEQTEIYKNKKFIAMEIAEKILKTVKDSLFDDLVSK